MISLWEEHLFWLEIIQDHAYFVRDHLSVKEVEYVRTAKQYIHLFDDLLKQLNYLSPDVMHNDPALIEFSRRPGQLPKDILILKGLFRLFELKTQ
jgi:hypothetical protein